MFFHKFQWFLINFSQIQPVPARFNPDSARFNQIQPDFSQIQPDSPRFSQIEPDFSQTSPIHSDSARFSQMQPRFSQIEPDFKKFSQIQPDFQNSARFSQILGNSARKSENCQNSKSLNCLGGHQSGTTHLKATLRGHLSRAPGLIPYPPRRLNRHIIFKIKNLYWFYH